jgi:hypothetical protein
MFGVLKDWGTLLWGTKNISFLQYWEQLCVCCVGVSNWRQRQICQISLGSLGPAPLGPGSAIAGALRRLAGLTGPFSAEIIKKSHFFHYWGQLSSRSIGFPFGGKLNWGKTPNIRKPTV